MSRQVRFAGTTAVITGGASGIGKGIAQALKAAGSNVVIADIDEASLIATADEIGALPVRTDVTDPVSVAELSERVLDEFGEIHVVCNNAGVGPFGSLENMTLADWQWVIDINLHGVMHGIASFLPILRNNSDWGHVVNTSSLSVLLTPPNTAAYVASKAAVLGLTEVLNAELRASGSVVGATALLPGTVQTNIRRSLRSRVDSPPSGLYEVDLAESGKPFRWLTPRDVGAMVLEAIRTNQPYLITHPEFRPHIAQRFDLIAAGVPVTPQERPSLM